METFGLYDDAKNKNNIAFKIYGDRFHSDQTLYEYLIEFLLIFSSAKSKADDYSEGKLSFHKKGDRELVYVAERKIGLKRFIFYNSSKKDTSIPLDKDAYNYLIEAVLNKIDANENEKHEIVAYLQDLLRGYAVVLKKRSWCAQQTLPICPELIFTEAMPNQKERMKITAADEISIDSKFEFAQRNFLARGGELYYLHILQALNNDENDSRRDLLESLLNHLLLQQSNKISKIARFIQDTWVERLNLSDTDKDKLFQTYKIGWIPAEAYKEIGNYAVEELINYLSANIQQINKIEILAQGLMFQVLRMLYIGACNTGKIEKHPWIMDMSIGRSSTLKKVSSNSFRIVEDDFKTVIDDVAKTLDISDTKEILSEIKKAQRESLEIFRAKGKEIRCIVPVSGAFERFTLSEDILRFLTLATIKPGQKMTLDTFMDNLYKHFNIVIGPKQYKESLGENSLNSMTAIGNALEENVKYFQDFLSSIGCLKELSDATSIVVNSYSRIER